MSWLAPTIVSPQDLSEAILEFVRYENDTNKRPASLASLGYALSRRFGRPFKMLSPERTLTTFIQRYLPDKIELSHDPAHPLVMFASIKGRSQSEGPYSDGAQRFHPLPHTLVERRDNTANAVDRSFPLQTQIQSSPSLPKLHRLYDSTFWAAFAKPLTAGYKRYLNTRIPITFYDLSETAAAPEGFIEIENGHIAPASIPPGPFRSEYVNNQIRDWLEKHQLKGDAFERQEGSTTRVETPKTQIPTLIKLLSKLDEQDLAKIAMPADIWMKLLRS